MAGKRFIFGFVFPFWLAEELKKDGGKEEMRESEGIASVNLGLIVPVPAHDFHAAKRSRIAIISNLFNLQLGVYAYRLQLVKEQLERIPCLHPLYLA